MQDTGGDELPGTAMHTGSDDGEPGAPLPDLPLSPSDLRLLEQLGRHSDPVVEAVEDRVYPSADAAGALPPVEGGAPDPLDPTFLAPPA